MGFARQCHGMEYLLGVQSQNAFDWIAAVVSIDYLLGGFDSGADAVANTLGRDCRGPSAVRAC
jgi:hypothetical protein